VWDHCLSLKRAPHSPHFEIGLCTRWPPDEKGCYVRQMPHPERDLKALGIRLGLSRGSRWPAATSPSVRRAAPEPRDVTGTRSPPAAAPATVLLATTCVFACSPTWALLDAGCEKGPVLCYRCQSHGNGHTNSAISRPCHLFTGRGCAAAFAMVFSEDAPTICNRHLHNSTCSVTGTDIGPNSFRCPLTFSAFQSTFSKTPLDPSARLHL
jgi:hypothetical protein